MISNRKNYALTLVSSFSGHAASMLVNLISVPISLNYWGKEKYGLFAIINSVIVYLSISNLGLNSAASILIAKNSLYADKITILKRSFFLLLLSLSVFAVAFLSVNWISTDWVFLLGDISDALFSETYSAMLVLVAFFFVNAIFAHIDSVFNGFQRLYILKFFDMLFLFMSFAVLLITVFRQGALWYFVFLNGCARLFVSIAKLLYFWLIICKECQTQLEPCSSDLIVDSNPETSYGLILATGLKMVMISVAAMFVWHSDNLLISHFLGLGHVAEYSVTFRIFYAFFSMIAVLNGAILPLIAKEMSIGNWEWINKVFSMLFKLMALVGGLFWLGSIVFLRDFIVFWAGSDGYAGLVVLVILGAYSYLMSMANLSAGVAIAMNYVNEVALAGVLEAVIKIVSSVVLIRGFHLAGVAVGTVFGSLAGPILFLPLMLARRKENRLKYAPSFVVKHLLFVIFPSVLGAVLVQVYVDSPFVRFVAGSVLIMLYLAGSKVMLPNEVVTYLGNLFPERYKFWH